MSYSFSVRGANKDVVGSAVKAELVKIVAAQPVHETDKMEALSNAVACIEVLNPTDAHDIMINCSGSIAMTEDGRFTACNINASAYLVNKE